MAASDYTQNAAALLDEIQVFRQETAELQRMVIELKGMILSLEHDPEPKISSACNNKWW